MRKRYIAEDNFAPGGKEILLAYGLVFSLAILVLVLHYS
jgi:hypothetical protein